MRNRILLGAAFSLVAATALHAAITAEDIVAQYQAAGYQRIEVRVGATTAKVEAIRDGMKIEVTYDLASGAILKSETGAVRPGEDVTPGVEVRTGRDDDSSGRSGRGGADDDADDDHGPGDDDGPDHDRNDDHGGRGRG
jgi:hypothetical protein